MAKVVLETYFNRNKPSGAKDKAKDEAEEIDGRPVALSQ
jgi:hypothetical protein